MNIPFAKKLYVLIFSIFFAHALLAQIPPAMSPPRLINDFADIIPAGKEQALEQKLVRYNDSTSTQIVVAALNSLNGDEPYNVAHEIIEQWGVGQKGKDNGVVILIAPNERKTFISTGYGVEHILTDAICKQIIDDYMLPHFRTGNYYGGIDNAANIMFGLMVGQYQADDIMGSGETNDAFVFLFIFLFILFFWVILPAYINRKNGYTYSGQGRQDAGRSSSGFPPIIFWGGGSSGHSGHDSWGDFSSGGGDFGGFGGGSGGGGGAGGEW